MNVLVIDVGTSSMRGILFEHQGKCLTEKQEFYQATYLENSWVEPVSYTHLTLPTNSRV